MSGSGTSKSLPQATVRDFLVAQAIPPKQGESRIKTDAYPRSSLTAHCSSLGSWVLGCLPVRGWLGLLDWRAVKANNNWTLVCQCEWVGGN